MGCGSCGSGGGCSGGCSSGAGCGSSRAGTKACPATHVYDWLAGIGVSPPVHYEAVEVTFKANRKAYYKNASDMLLVAGDYVIVEADRGIDFGVVQMTGELVRLRLRSKGLEGENDFPNIIRRPSLEEIDRWEAKGEYEAESFHIARQAIDKLQLNMKLVDVEWQLDRNKVTFYFTAEHRVDFRQLVRDLAGRFRTRVELRQIGARDEAARLGGIGSCGRELCCSTWLQEFQPVSTQAAKIQNLPLNPTRLSGQCGRLKCCLNYELEQYMTALEAFPLMDTPVKTSHGGGTVQKIDIFKNRVWIVHPDGTWEDKPLEEVRELLGIAEDEPAREISITPPASGGNRRGTPRSR
jgi:cell fate regulator YaaT (PSP1 superfamily)